MPVGPVGASLAVVSLMWKGQPVVMRYLGDPALRTEAAPVTEFPFGLLLDEVVKCMIDAAKGNQGVAAPQLGVSLRMAIITAEGKQRLIINPGDVKLGGVERPGIEGCLSLPDFTTQVRRYSEIDFNYFSPDGRIHSLSLAGGDARCAQHELDHLDGKLIIDQVSRQQRRQAERKVQNFLSKQARTR